MRASPSRAAWDYHRNLATLCGRGSRIKKMVALLLMGKMSEEVRRCEGRIG